MNLSRWERHALAASRMRTTWLSLAGALAACQMLAGCSAETATEADKVGTTRSPVQATQDSETQRIQAWIESQYSQSAVHHSYRTQYAEDIDCVDFFEQPSFHTHPGRKRPAAVPHAPTHHDSVNPSAAAFSVGDGSIDENGNSRVCPDGSVPIVRPSVDRIKAVGGLDAWLAAGRRKAPAVSVESAKEPLPPSNVTFHYAWGVPIFYPNDGTGYQMGSTLAVYNPYDNVGAPSDEHSISQIWLVSGGGVYCATTPPTISANCEQTLEVGWNVDSLLYGEHGDPLVHVDDQ